MLITRKNAIDYGLLTYQTLTCRNNHKSPVTRYLSGNSCSECMKERQSKWLKKQSLKKAYTKQKPKVEKPKVEKPKVIPTRDEIIKQIQLSRKQLVEWCLQIQKDVDPESWEKSLNNQLPIIKFTKN